MRQIATSFEFIGYGTFASTTPLHDGVVYALNSVSVLAI